MKVLQMSKVSSVVRPTSRSINFRHFGASILPSWSKFSRLFVAAKMWRENRDLFMERARRSVKVSLGLE